MSENDGASRQDIRVWVLLIAGLALLFYEAIVRDFIDDAEPRPGLLMLYTGMLGLPAYLIRRNGNGKPSGEHA